MAQTPPLERPPDPHAGGRRLTPVAPTADGAAPEGLWAAAAQAGEDAVFGINNRGEIDVWTQPARRLFGWQSSEVIGRPARDLFSKGPGDNVVVKLSRALSGERIDRVPATALRRDGLLVPVTVTLAPVTEGQTVCAIVRDVTEQFLAQKALADTHRRQAEVLALSRVGSWLWDTRTDAIQLSDGLYEIHGLVPLDFEGTMAARLRLAHPDDRRKVRRRLDEALAGRQPYDLEYRTVRPDGTVVWVYERASLELAQDGSVAGMSGICQDVTERRQAADAVRHHAGQLELLQRIAVAANEADDLADAVQRCLTEICTLLEWNMGHAVIFDHSGQVERQLWHSVGTSRFEEFRRLLGQRVPSVPEGPVLQPLTDDLLVQMQLPMGAARPQCRFSFSVAIEGQTKVLVELYSVQSRDIEDQWLRVAEHAAIQIGRVVERERSKEALAHQALHDPLTNLPNRTLFLDRLGQSLRGLASSGSHLAVMFIDLDNFKLINDSLGHEVGDRVLTAVASRLVRVMRDGDTAARFGGDEFIILCERLNTVETVAEIANRLLAALEEPIVLDGQVSSVVTASIGIAIANTPLARPDHLLRDADAAMYRAKEEGKGRFHVFDPALHERASRKLSIASELRRAVGNSELRLEFQPQVRIADGRIIGVESLVRWDNPARGLMSPAEWVPIAEETQQIVSVGEWILFEACRTGARWLDQLGDRADDFKIGVNVSATQLARPELIDSVVAAVAETGIDPSRICIEITESVLMSAPAVYLEALLGLKLVGASIAIDDFGTGYSSLAYLRRFPIDVIKIDKSFVDDLVYDDRRGTAVMKAIVQLSDALGVTCLAEGVETAEQAAVLHQAGCYGAQGFLYSRPRRPEDISALLDAARSDLLLPADGRDGRPWKP